MNILSAKNPRIIDTDPIIILLTVTNDKNEVFDYPVAENDPVQYSADLYRDAVNGEFGAIVPYVEPPEPQPEIPKSITPRQCRLALLNANLLPTVEAAIASMTGPEGEAARITWDYATEVRRDDPLLMQLTSALAITSAQVDEMFLAASVL